MLTREEKGAATAGGSCDIRVWSGACEHGADDDSPETYLCQFCATIPGLDHEVRHELFPHVSGDYERMM
jgi:hypothetical protein